MSFEYALILSLFIAAVMTENYGYGYWMFSRPIFAGPLLGLVMGDLNTGLLVGASVELMYMGVLPIGGSVPPNAQIAGMIGTVFAIMSGGKVEVGIALALPIGILAQFLIMLAWNCNILLMHRADEHLRNGNTKGVERTHLFGLVIFFFVFFVSTFLAVYYGSEWVSALVKSLPQWFMDGLRAASGILPAVGMAMLLKMMNLKKYWPFFSLGFLFAVYLKMDVLAISLLGLSVAAAIHTFSRQTASASSPVSEGANSSSGGLLTPKELRATFVRSFFGMTSINYERFCSLGFCYAMIPALKKLYPDVQQYKEALARHNEFFNCHPYTGNAVLGVSLALEEQRAMGKPITAEVISSTKAALMGPLSGIGDSIFKATFMTIFAALGAGLALDGNIMGPFVFLIPNVILNVGSRWYFIKYGHKLGTSLVIKMKQSNLLENFVQNATIVGLMVVGAMIVGFVRFSVSATWVSGGKTIVLQELIDKIFPNLLPLLITIVFYQLISKSRKGTYWCILLSFVLGIGGKLLGVI